MNKKLVKLLSLILIVLFSITSVYASEDDLNLENEIEENNQETEVLNDNELSEESILEEKPIIEEQEELEDNLIVEEEVEESTESVEENNLEEESTEVVEEITNILYRTHIQDYGWEKEFKKNGELSGTSHQSKRLEAIELKIESNLSGGIEYKTHIQDYGWETEFKKDGEMSGTSHQSKRLEAIEIRLYGELAEKYDIYYRVHIEHIGWMNWAKNGETAGTAGYSYRMEAIEIRLVSKEETIELPVSGVQDSFRQKRYSMQAHVQNIGWQEIKYDEERMGTTGESKRIEAFSISLNPKTYNGSIEYRSHVQNYGWLDWKKDGEISGTTGESKRVEAIEIKLSGEISENYDIYYRVHAQNFGWMSWAKNGEPAGSSHVSCRIEAIEILILGKDQTPPVKEDTKTNKAYIDGEGWKIIDGQKYYFYKDGTRARYVSKINGKRYEFSANGELEHEDVRLVIDVSSHNKKIDWDRLWNSGEIDGVIVRVAAGAEVVDSEFNSNMQAIERLHIPYGLYIYSYAENYDEGKIYAEFVKNHAARYLDNATLGIYFDLESNVITSYLTTSDYDKIVEGFKDILPNAQIYTYTYYSDTVLNSTYLKNLTTWIANYAVTECPGRYRGWQYTSKGKATGISTAVDFSIFYY